MTVSVGQQLKNARTEQRINLAEVTEATKIQPWVLDALETDQLLATMSPVYAKSFLAAYAKFLRLDPHPLIAQLFPPPPAAVSGGPEGAEESQVAPASSAVAFEGARELLISAARRLLPLAFIGAVAAIVVAAKPLRWLSSTRVTQASLSAPIKASEVPRDPASAVNAIAPSSRRAPAAASPIPALPLTAPLELRIIAHRPSWISVKTDGDLVAQQQLTPGAKERWAARRRIELVLGNPAQVDIALNGQSISPLAVAYHGRLLITHRGVAPLKPDESR